MTEDAVTFHFFSPTCTGQRTEVGREQFGRLILNSTWPFMTDPVAQQTDVHLNTIFEALLGDQLLASDRIGELTTAATFLMTTQVSREELEQTCNVVLEAYPQGLRLKSYGPEQQEAFETDLQGSVERQASGGPTIPEPKRIEIPPEKIPAMMAMIRLALDKIRPEVTENDIIFASLPCWMTNFSIRALPRAEVVASFAETEAKAAIFAPKDRLGEVLNGALRLLSEENDHFDSSVPAIAAYFVHQKRPQQFDTAKFILAGTLDGDFVCVTTFNDEATFLEGMEKYFRNEYAIEVMKAMPANETMH